MLWKVMLRNTTISGSLMGVGDFTAQYLDYQQTHSKKFNISELNFKRWYHYTLMNGFSNGIGLTLWYKFLEWRFPVRKPFSVVKKIMLDEAIFAPISISSYIMLSNYLENKPKWSNYQNTFLDIWKTDLLVWPLSNSINFKYIPVGYQPVWTSVISLGWNIFISYRTNKKNNTTTFSNSLDSSD